MSKKTVNSRNIDKSTAMKNMNISAEELASQIRDVWVKEYGEDVVAKFLPKKEPDDEKIRKELIKFLNDCYNIDSGFFTRYCKIPFKQMLSWLEKQGTSYTKMDVDEAFVEGMACAKNELEKQGEQKPAWSEADSDFMYDTLSNLTELKDRYGKDYGNVGKCIDWLKSLKERATWKPSDKQMEAVKKAFRELFARDLVDEDFVSLINDLKNL